VFNLEGKVDATIRMNSVESGHRGIQGKIPFFSFFFLLLFPNSEIGGFSADLFESDAINGQTLNTVIGARHVNSAVSNKGRCLGGAVQFASASGQGSGKARKSVEQPRKMAVAGRKQCHSAKRIALAYKQVI